MKGRIVETGGSPEARHFAKRVSKPKTGAKANRARARAAKKARKGK